MVISSFHQNKPRLARDLFWFLLSRLNILLCKRPNTTIFTKTAKFKLKIAFFWYIKRCNTALFFSWWNISVQMILCCTRNNCSKVLSVSFWILKWSSSLILWFFFPLFSIVIFILINCPFLFLDNSSSGTTCGESTVIARSSTLAVSPNFLVTVL